MMGSPIASLAALDGAFTLLTIITDPAKAKERLAEIAEATKVIAGREAAVTARETAVGKMKADVVELDRRLGDVRGATEAGRVKLEKEVKELETAQVELAARSEKITTAQREKEQEFRERERIIVSRQAKMTAQEKALADQSSALDARAGALDTREADVREMEAATAARRARLAEALSA